ncbi:helix-turn-helix domain-containing protein [Chitinophaga caseinilytica]|uniref:helix-turn-helix domain-containing protein n=1 Tax=Chitinophaga caseinilytica TaxID=2267521 RepID=UPI003C2F3380
MNIHLLRSAFMLLNTDYVQLDHHWRYRNVTSTFYRLYYIDGGEGKLYNHAETVSLEAGFIYLIPSFTTCNYECRHHLSQYYISFTEESSDGTSLFATNRKLFKLRASEDDIRCVKRILDLNPNRTLGNTYDPRDYEKTDILKGFQDLNNLLRPSEFIEVSGLLLQLISRFMGAETFFMEERRAIPSKILDAIYFMQTNLRTNITVELLAARASQHPDYFSRLFLKNTGERPLAFLQAKRIERVQLLLVTTDYPFYRIAEETGFESLSYLSRVFRKQTGQTLGAYRKQHEAVK